jgi:hypothetical protein
MSTKCSWAECSGTTEHPGRSGWKWLQDHPGISDGFYCPDHAGLIEICEKEGGVLNDGDEPA